MSPEFPNRGSDRARSSDAEGDNADPDLVTRSDPAPPGRGRQKRTIGAVAAIALAVFAVVALFFVRHHIVTQMRANLPQLDGSQVVYGLAAPVTVQRDAQGVPHIHADSLDDLIFAQGYITAQDRLWQMDLLRRHAAGQLAEIIGRSMLEHDRLQRTLQLRTAADHAAETLPAEQRHWLDVYARGVNASVAAQHGHLPIEFHLLSYEPAPWTPRDSILIAITLYQDLTNGFPAKLGREALAAKLPPELIADLYPIGSWRDHPAGQAIPDVTAPQPAFQDVPLDESQSNVRKPAIGGMLPANLFALNKTLALFHESCDTCVAGSNGWVVSGTRTASGKPLLSNDMHLSLSVPGLWYEADLQAETAAPMQSFHVAGVTLPGVPFVIAGHNQHVAWGFTNLGADVQDLFIEHTRGNPNGGAEFQTSAGLWSHIRYQSEIIHVRGGANVRLDVPLTRHGDVDTPIITSVYPNERRTLSLQWTIYDPANLRVPFLAINSATDWPSMLNAFAIWGGPPMNVMYADDQGHIGYHVVGHIPIRGDVSHPDALSPVPVDVAAPDASSHEWAGYIPFAELPQAFDPTDGVLVTANARVTLDGYRYPITLNWMAPYRTERIYRVLEADPTSGAGDSATAVPSLPTPSLPPDPHGTLGPIHKLMPSDMLALQNDVFSELDLVIGQRLAYSIDHATGRLKDDKQLHQAADILRKWNGSVDANEAAPVIVNVSRMAFWPMLLIPKLAPQFAAQLAEGADLSKAKGLSPEAAQAANLWQLYNWGERSSVEEQMLMHTPARWLPPGFGSWDDFLAAVVKRGLRDAHAPSDLVTWQQGKAFPVRIQHPIFSRVPNLGQKLIGVATETGPQSQSGDGTTVKQVGLAFGPSERFTTDLGDADRTTLNIVLGESGNPASAWFMDQFHNWLVGTTYALPFSRASINAATTHTLTLTPR